MKGGMLMKVSIVLMARKVLFALFVITVYAIIFAEKVM